MPYAPLVSKIRCHNPNKKSAAIANRNYVSYIATREGVDLSPSADINMLLDKVDSTAINLNENVLYQEADNPKYIKYMAERPRSHGLFGNIDCTDLNKVCAIVSNETKSGKNIYRGIISLSEKDADLLDFQDKQHWETYLRSVMPDIAQSLGINPTNYTWVAAFHAEQSHPHVHYEVWSNENRVKSPYIHTSVQKEIRVFLSEQMFTPEYEQTRKEILSAEFKELYSNKNISRDEVTSYVKELMEGLSEPVPGIAKTYLPSRMSSEDLEYLGSQLQLLASELPDTGRIYYKFMPPELKTKIDFITNSIISRPDIAAAVDTYIETAGKISKLNGKTKDDIEYAKNQAHKELYKRCGNILIKSAKELRNINNNIDIPTPIPTAENIDSIDSTNSEITNYQTVITIPENIYNKNRSQIIVEPEDHIPNSYFIEWTNEYRMAIDEIYNDGDLKEAFASLEKQSIAGNALAINEVAKIIERELLDIPTTEATEYYNEALRAFKLVYEQSSENEYIKEYAAYRIGKIYEYGKGDLEIDYNVAEAWYKEATKNKYAQYSLAKLYLTQKVFVSADCDIKSNQQAAFELLEKSSNANNPFASYELGTMYKNGIYIKCNQEEANRYYEKALNKFLAMSENSTDDSLFYKIGIMYLNGLGTDVNNVEGEKFIKKAADLGNENAILKLASIYLEKDVVELRAKAISMLTELAEKHNPMAQYKLGSIYSNPELPEYFDMVKAIEYLEKSAEQGNQFAQYKLGTIYSNPELPEYFDMPKAIDYLEKAAEQGNQFAQYKLGAIYSNAEFPEYFDMVKAIDYLEKAAEQGNQFAQYKLGAIYSNLETPGLFDLLKAIKRLEQASSQGNEFAKYRLGCIYLSKDYACHNLQKGLAILEECAKKGNVFAQYKLGVSFLYGKDDLPHDEHIGRYWLEQAHAAGYGQAGEALKSYDEYKASIVSSMGYQAFRNIASCIATANAEQRYYANATAHTPHPSKDNKQAMRETARKHGVHIDQDE